MAQSFVRLTAAPPAVLRSNSNAASPRGSATFKSCYAVCEFGHAAQVAEQIGLQEELLRLEALLRGPGEMGSGRGRGWFMQAPPLQVAIMSFTCAGSTLMKPSVMTMIDLRPSRRPPSGQSAPSAPSASHRYECVPAMVET